MDALNAFSLLSHAHTHTRTRMPRGTDLSVFAPSLCLWCVVWCRVMLCVVTLMCRTRLATLTLPYAPNLEYTPWDHSTPLSPGMLICYKHHTDRQTPHGQARPHTAPAAHTIQKHHTAHITLDSPATHCDRYPAADDRPTTAPPNTRCDPQTHYGHQAAHPSLCICLSGQTHQRRTKVKDRQTDRPHTHTQVQGTERQRDREVGEAPTRTHTLHGHG